jgi:hypothetical protein
MITQLWYLEAFANEQMIFIKSIKSSQPSSKSKKKREKDENK